MAKTRQSHGEDEVRGFGAGGGVPGAEPAGEAQTSARAATMVAREPKTDPPVSEAPGDDELQTLSGRYRHAGGAREQQALEDAVDEVVADMNLIARPIARERLLEANEIPQRLSVEVSGDRVTVSFDGRSYTATVGGPAVSVVGVTGDPLKLTLRVDKSTLVQRFVGSRGGKTNRFSNHGQNLRLQVRVHSESLPKDLVYRLTYRRS